MKKFNESQIANMVKELENNSITIKEIDRKNQIFLVKYNGLMGIIGFSDFSQDLDIFKINIELYANEPQTQII